MTQKRSIEQARGMPAPYDVVALLRAAVDQFGQKPLPVAVSTRMVELLEAMIGCGNDTTEQLLRVRGSFEERTHTLRKWLLTGRVPMPTDAAERLLAFVGAIVAEMPPTARGERHIIEEYVLVAIDNNFFDDALDILRSVQMTCPTVAYHDGIAEMRSLISKEAER